MEAGTTALVAQLCASGAATVVATADADGRAAITRGWGVSVAPDGRVTLCISASPATRANLAANGRIAVTIVDPTTYASVHAKGVADVVLDPTDRERAAEAMKAAGVVGIPASASPSWSSRPVADRPRRPDPRSLERRCGIRARRWLSVLQ